MHTHGHEVRLVTEFELIKHDDRPVPVDVEIRYDAREPLTVRITLGMADIAPVTWWIGRSLLAEGMTAMTGEGDIHVAPLSEVAALLRLRSAGSEACFRVPKTEIQRFLRDAYELVPAHCEADWLGLDEVLARLLAEEANSADINFHDR
jgi:sporulation and cell division protein SsgA